MTKWQEVYINQFCKGKMPKSEIRKIYLELLGKVREKVTVHFPKNTNKGERTETYIVSETECDIPNGIIRVDVLASNLFLWTDRGYKIVY